MIMSNAIKENFNFMQNSSGIVASMGLESLGKSAAGNLVTPAIWALNYTASESRPTGIDVGIYAVGFLNAPASIITSIFKSVVDDDINKKVNMIRQQHDAKFRLYIQPVQNFGGMSAPYITATTIAGKGGVAWQGKNGQWVYITDAQGFPVCDFVPNNYLNIWQPNRPLTMHPNGEFMICSRSC
jgi:hypothetical protein